MKCIYCNRDLNAIGQDNISSVPGYPICEDCGSSNNTYETVRDVQITDKKDKYSYYLNIDNNILFIYEENAVLAELSGVLSNEQATELFKEIVFELRGIEI